MMARIRAMTGMHWLALFGVILTAWAAMFMMSAALSARLPDAGLGRDFWLALCGTGAADAPFAALFGMWSVMAAAMMLPTALPFFVAFDDVARGEGGLGRLVAGYLVVWLGFAVVAAALQVGLARAAMVDPSGRSLSPWLSAGLVVAAGLYQFSALKNACVTRCRMPLAFLIEHWDAGPFRMGLRHGLHCLGCCVALMLLAFVGGTMSLAFMGLGTVLMTLEKLPDLGARITRPLGTLLIIAGFGMAALALGGVPV